MNPIVTPKDGKQIFWPAIARTEIEARADAQKALLAMNKPKTADPKAAN